MEGRCAGRATQHRQDSKSRLEGVDEFARSTTRFDDGDAPGFSRWSRVVMSIPSTRDNWDQHWQNYSDTAEQNPAQNYRHQLALSLLDATGDGAGMRIIDIGSGQGDMAAAIRARFPAAEIMGLELAQSGV